MKKELLIGEIVNRRIELANEEGMSGKDIVFRNAGELHDFGLFVTIDGVKIEDNKGYYAQFKMSLYHGLLNEVNRELVAVC